eukprot:scaffold2636_cov340-Pavlova_lutheri.AAC.155
MRCKEEAHDPTTRDSKGDESKDQEKGDPDVSERVTEKLQDNPEESKAPSRMDPQEKEEEERGSKDQPHTVASKQSKPCPPLEEGNESTSTSGQPESGTGETPTILDRVDLKGKQKVQGTGPKDAAQGKPMKREYGSSQDKATVVAENVPEDPRDTHVTAEKAKAAAHARSHPSSSEEEDRPIKKPRLVWTPELHNRFMNAVNHLGIKNAVPKTILQLMNVEGMTRENVASHLQKYRLFLKRTAGLPPNAALPSDTAVQVPHVHTQSAGPSAWSDKPRDKSTTENTSPTREGNPSPAPEATAHSYPPFMGMQYGSHMMPPFPMGMGMGMGMGMHGQALQSFYPFGGIPWWTGEYPGEGADPRSMGGSQPPEEKNGTS